MPDPNPAADAANAEAERYRRVVSKAWNDPVIGAAVRKLAKDAIPDLVLPEDNLEPVLAPLRAENSALAAELKALREDRAADKKEREERQQKRLDESFATSLDEAATRFNLTAEGKEMMLARMKETKNYTDPMGAAAYIVSQNPPPAPAGPAFGAGDLNFAGSSTVDPKYQLLHQNPEKYFDSEVRAMLANPKAYVSQEMGPQYAELAFGR